MLLERNALDSIAFFSQCSIIFKPKSDILLIIKYVWVSLTHLILYYQNFECFQLETVRF